MIINKCFSFQMCFNLLSVIGKKKNFTKTWVGKGLFHPETPKSQSRSSRQDPRGRSWSRPWRTALSELALMSWAQPRVTYPGVALPAMTGALPHHSIFKNMPHRQIHRPVWKEIPQLQFITRHVKLRTRVNQDKMEHPIFILKLCFNFSI